MIIYTLKAALAKYASDLRMAKSDLVTNFAYQKDCEIFRKAIEWSMNHEIGYGGVLVLPDGCEITKEYPGGEPEEDKQ